MREPARSILLALMLVGCGGAATTAEEPTEDVLELDCEAARRDERSAQQRLAACRATSPASEWRYQASFDWLETELGGRLDAARRELPAEASRLDLQQIAERVWALVDEIPEEERDAALLARVEDATEQLMRPLEPDELGSALATAAGALGALREQLEPAPTGDPCAVEAAEAAGAWMAAQAVCPLTETSGGEAP